MCWAPTGSPAGEAEGRGQTTIGELMRGAHAHHWRVTCYSMSGSLKVSSEEIANPLGEGWPTIPVSANGDTQEGESIKKGGNEKQNSSFNLRISC